MQNDPAEEWRSLTETYRAMFDGELENLAADMDDLTETAREVLRSEMKSRGLAMPGEKRFAAAPRSGGAADDDLPIGFESEEDGGNDGAPDEFTWKVPLMECEDQAHALAVSEALSRAGIQSWYEGAGGGGGSPRLVVAADQLDQAQQIAAVPIDQQILDAYREEAPAYAIPVCPDCGEEDPILESAEPTNSWLCEACGNQWTESAADSEDAAGAR